MIDPAYDPQGILDLLAADGMRLTGALATHYHADHVGGDLLGYDVAGIASCSSSPRCRSTCRPTSPSG